MKVERVPVLDISVSAINMEMALAVIGEWVAGRDKQYVTITGVHGVMESHRDAVVRDIHERAGLVTPDGMPLVWLLKAAGYKFADRVYGPDLMLRVFERGYRHFFYGTTEERLRLLRSNLEARSPQARVVGMHAPPFAELSAYQDRKVVELINASEPDIVWVGLSTPKQEKWMAAHRAVLNAPVLIGVGAAFDIHAGVTKQAPRFVQRSGLEWLYRLLQEPRRLARRYLVNNPQFVYLLARQKIALRR